MKYGFTFLCLAIVAGLTCPSHAQVEHRVVLHGGINFSNKSYVTSIPNATIPDYQQSEGFVTGVGYQLKSKRLAFTAEINYTRFQSTLQEKSTISGLVRVGSMASAPGTLTTDATLTYTYEYVEIPLQVGYYLVQDKGFRVRAMAGPWLAVALGGELRQQGTETLSSAPLGNQTGIFDFKQALKIGSDDPDNQMSGFQFGIIGGFGFEYVLNDRVMLSLEPRYILGLTDLKPDSGNAGSTTEISEFHRVLNVLLRVGFRL